MQFLKFISLSTILVFSLLTNAHSNEHQFNEVLNDPTWKGLLQIFYNKKTGDENFYLSGKEGGANEELKLSLEAMLSTNGKSSFACRFPARYFYLAKKFNQNNPLSTIKECQNVMGSIEVDRIEGIDIVLVGSYLSNPASSFGHTLLRVRQKSIMGIDKDLSFNYGALIPLNENPVSYITKGIFGFYEAAYSDQDPFIHDLTYAHMENRDSWSFAVKHTPDDRLLIALHLWEMAGVKFKYFFFSRNCAWQMGQSLGLTFEKRNSEISSIPWWTLPVDVVHHLQDRNLISSVEFLPSHERKLNSSIKRLSDVDFIKYNEIINGGFDPNPAKDSAELIDVIIDYYNWRHSGSRSNEPMANIFAQRRERAIQARLQLPPYFDVVSEKPQPSPVEGNKPIKLVFDYDGKPGLKWTVYSQGRMDPHTLGLGNIEALVFDFKQNNGWHLKGLKLIDVERLNVININQRTSFQPSWRTSVEYLEDDEFKFRMKGSYGLSFGDRDAGTVLYANLLTDLRRARLYPSINFILKRNKINVNIELPEYGAVLFALQYQVNKSHFVGFKLKTNNDHLLSINAGMYW